MTGICSMNEEKTTKFFFYLNKLFASAKLFSFTACKIVSSAKKTQHQNYSIAARILLRSYIGLSVCWFLLLSFVLNAIQFKWNFFFALNYFICPTIDVLIMNELGEKTEVQHKKKELRRAYKEWSETLSLSSMSRIACISTKWRARMQTNRSILDHQGK